MDSGNSGSLQSSSGGDDEFDSRAGGGGGVDSSPLSTLLRSSPSPSSAAFSLHGSYFGLQEFTSAPPPQQQQQQQGAWSGSFAGASSGLPSSSSPRVAHADAGAPRPQGADTASASSAAAQGQPGGVSAPAPAQQQAPRGSRKRTRASRRAPTTVLTTDTSNFRAMVQEFTGIPSPPFGAGVAGIGLGGPAASLRTRFDHIFPPPSTSLRSGAADASLPPYLLRPYPHKLPTAPSSFPPFTSSSSPSSATPSSSNIGAANANAAATGAATNTAAAASSNPAAPAAAGDTYQQLTPSALLRLQQDASSYLSFQNLLDTHPSSQSIFGPAAGGGFAQAQSSRLHDPAPSPSDFLAGVGGSSHSLGFSHGGLLGSEGAPHLHHSRSSGDELSGVVAAGASGGGGGSCKLNYSSHAGAAASSSGAAGADNKPPDGGGPGRAGRGDGLDPWICTSE
ncbi:unnamed protein product [Urochloa humidicola]